MAVQSGSEQAWKVLQQAYAAEHHHKLPSAQVLSQVEHCSCHCSQAGKPSHVPHPDRFQLFSLWCLSMGTEQKNMQQQQQAPALTPKTLATTQAGAIMPICDGCGAAAEVGCPVC